MPRLRLLTHRHLPVLLAAIAVALLLPALGVGFQLDDYFLRLALADPPIDPHWSRTPVDLFAFFKDESLVRYARETGAAPWWTPDEFRLAFSRPLSGVTHWLDFRWWGDRPSLMHAHSLAWFGACIVVATVLYRRLLPPPVAGLAALFFALDDTHGTPAVWIANRNAMVAALFALLALAAHDRWRRQGWRPGAALAPALLLAALLGGELAVAAGGYLLGYALFMEEGSWRRRMLSLVPGAAVGAAWALVYRAAGYGTRNSMLYVDPVASPAEFMRAFVERAPVLFFGQWALPADLYGLFSPDAARVAWLVCASVSVLVLVQLAPLLRHDRVARFLATGMLISLVPAAATFPNGRLLFLTGFGGAGLLGQWLAGVRAGAPWVPPAGRWRVVARLLVWPALLVHGVIAPLGLLAAPEGVRMLGNVVERSARSLPRDPAFRGQSALFVTTPTAFLTGQALLVRGLSNDPVPSRALVLGSGVARITVRRLDDRTLALRPRYGYLAEPGRAAPDDANQPPPLSRNHFFAIFDRLFRGSPSMGLGERVSLPGVDIEVVAVTEEARPLEVAFHFAHPLEDVRYRWLRWQQGDYVEFALPPVGETVELPGATVDFGRN